MLGLAFGHPAASLGHLAFGQGGFAAPSSLNKSTIAYDQI
ncbi:hypothetical protein SGRA_0920 [Saprospira grandis str. Lewin]|uniref:Uncharacterized protein n=1 Tax=Saprospira grandis (strain Lewin) TaxID=984262 RepID=H6L2J8_SAPGL|nr:hypothetical protein SGRA_0920 [Saprospira grandis str. Lewin]